MVSVSWFVRAWFMLVVGLAAALPAAAQSDRGEYQIVQARYGTEAHNVDVTQRLKELARQDSRLKVTNSMFGVDPDIGAHKTLRIFARGPDGAVRMFEYEERSYIEGSQFTSSTSDSISSWNSRPLTRVNTLSISRLPPARGRCVDARGSWVSGSGTGGRHRLAPEPDARRALGRQPRRRLERTVTEGVACPRRNLRSRKRRIVADRRTVR